MKFGGKAQSTDSSTDNIANGNLEARLHPQGTPVDMQPTAKEVGLDIEGIQKAHAFEDGLLAAKQGIGESDESVYSSHPIQSLQLGPYKFVKGVLKLSGNEARDFESFIETLPAVDRAGIRKVDLGIAEQMAKDHAILGGATKQFDSSVGRDALERLHQLTPTVGRQDISHASLPQMDHNIPVVPTLPIEGLEGTGLDQGAHIDPATVDKA